VPPSCELAGTILNFEDGSIWPPTVLYFIREDDDRFELASHLTGLDDSHLSDTGILKAIGMMLPSEIPGLLPLIEQWRWPDELPTEGLGGHDDFIPPLPPGARALSAALEKRGGWKCVVEPRDGDVLANLYPQFGHTDGEPGAVIRISKYDQSGLVWGGPGSTHLQFADHEALIAHLDSIESWTQNAPPGWVADNAAWRDRQCPRCGAEGGIRCGGAGYADKIHFERVAIDGFDARSSPVPTERGAGKPVAVPAPVASLTDGSIPAPRSEKRPVTVTQVPRAKNGPKPGQKPVGQKRGSRRQRRG
jgi:hypothetical protein